MFSTITLLIVSVFLFIVISPLLFSSVERGKSASLFAVFMIIEAVLLGIIVFNGFKIFLIGLSFVISITLNVIMAVLIIIGMIAAYRWVRRVTSNSDRNQQED